VISKGRKVYIENTIPILDLPSSLKVCPNNSVQLDAGILGGNYLWTPAIQISNDTVRNPMVSPLSNTWYTVSVTKCMITVKDSVLVEIESIVKPDIHQDRNTLYASAALFYQWYKNGRILEGAIDKTWEPDGAGHFSVRITNAQGCSSESDPFFYIPSSEKDKVLKGIRIKVSPNPNRGLVNILLSQLPEKPINVSVVDKNGRRVFHTTVHNNTSQLRLTTLPKGLYFLEFTIDRKKVVVSIVIQ
jgi:hypothetical protein